MQSENSQKNNNNLVIILLIIIIAILSALVVLFATNTISLNTNNSTEKNNESNEETKYKAYFKEDIITLSDNSRWFVIADSDENNDTVKLLSEDYFALYADCDSQTEHIYCDDTVNYSLLSDEVFRNSQITSYKGSNIEKYVNSYANLIPATLKEVDGYKIRLLSMQDIIEIDNKKNNWVKNEQDFGSYSYTGNNEFLKRLTDVEGSTWLMDVIDQKYNVNYANGGNFYTLQPQYDWTNPNNPVKTNIQIRCASSGLPNIRPVIYVLKDSIK